MTGPLPRPPIIGELFQLAGILAVLLGLTAGALAHSWKVELPVAAGLVAYFVGRRLRH